MNRLPEYNPATRVPDPAPSPVGAQPRGLPSDANDASALAWVGPFVVFMVWLGVDKYLPIANPWKEILRDAVIFAAIVGFSRKILPRTAPHWLASVALGLGVFAMWIAPDLLVPTWRSHWIFQNDVVGKLKTSIPPAELTPLMLALRVVRASLLVPIVEELFWRGWLPRWIQDPKFQRIPLGQYTPLAFWATAALFAAEHGPFWDVGLLCGILYNWWMKRTASLGDCVLVHATTNFALSMFIIASERWAFWM
jgi:CAAX prenyl protease-like protein